MKYFHLNGGKETLIDNPVIIEQLKTKEFKVGEVITVADKIYIELEVVKIADRKVIFKWTK